MPFSVGSLIGYLKLEGGPQFAAGVRSAQSSLDLTAASARKAGAAIDQTSAALTGAGRQADIAAAGSKRYQAAQLSLVAAQERYNKLAADQTTSTGRLASAQASLLRAQQQVARTTPVPPETISAFDRLSGKIRGVIGDTAKMAAGFAVIGGIFELGNAIKQANEFQRQMTLIQTQAGASAAQVKTMTDAVLRLSPQVATGPNDLAVALYHIQSAGQGMMSTAQELNVLKIAAEGAKVGNANLEETTNALTSTVASGIPGVQNMAQAMGMLNATVGAGDMKLSDLNQALGSGLLAVVKGYGLSLRDVGAALATFGDNNIRGAQAATMLRMAVQSMAVPMKTGQTSLELLGLKADTLAKDMSTGGLNKAIEDLYGHLQKIGKGQEIADLASQMQSFTGQVDASTVEASSLGQTLTAIFGKRAGPGLAVLLGQFDRLQEKYTALDNGAKSFGSAWDATTKTASFGFDKLKASAESAGIEIFSKVGPVLGQVASDIGVVLPAALHVLGQALAPVGAVFGAFGGLLKNSGGAASALATALRDLEPIIAPLGGLIIGWWAAVKGGEVAILLFGRLQAAVAAIPGAFTRAGASITAFWAGQSEAAVAGAAATGTAAAAVSEEAAAMSGAVDEAGATAAAGWAGLLGPLGAAAVGIGVLVTMFHKSSSASKEAADAAKAYTDALQSGGGGLQSSIIDQLSKNNIPEKIASLNKQLKQTAVTGPQFVAAIQNGGPALDALKTKLEGIIKAGSPTGPVRGNVNYKLDANGVNTAKQLLADVNAQVAGLGDAAKKEIAQFQAFGTVASSLDQVTNSLQLSAQAGQSYAGMLGYVADKSGVVEGVSKDRLAKAISAVAYAYNTATQTGNDYLNSLQTFAGTAGTAADRAALIGATLKNANGDALNFAAQMNGLAQATSQFATDIAGGAKNAGVSVKTFVNSLWDAKNNTIAFNKAAAGPMINDLQGIQSAAMNAAQAMYQHEVSTKGATKASDDAYAVYKQMTSGALTNYLVSIGDVDKKTGKLTKSAQALVDTYFGMPKDVKTQIEQEGADSVENILGRLELDMRAIADHKTVTQIIAEDKASGTLSSIEQQILTIQGQHTATVIVNERQGTVIGGTGPAAGKHIATGGLVSGPGSGTSDSIPAMLSNGEFVVRASQAQKHMNLLHAINKGVQGFAGGGPIGDFTVNTKSGGSHTNSVKSTPTSVSVSAGGGAAYAIATIIKSNIPQARLAMRDLSAAVNDAFQLSGVQSKLASLQADLKNLMQQKAQFVGQVQGTLFGQVDVSKYGDIGGMLSALQNGTDANNKFTGELNKLKAEGAPAFLLQQLAQAGPSAGLDTLAGASIGDARAAFQAFNSFTSSANTGGNYAGQDVFGSRIAADQKNIASLTKSQTALSNDVAKLVAAVAHVTKLPTSVTLNGHVLATAVIKDKAFDGVINELTHHLVYP